MSDDNVVYAYLIEERTAEDTGFLGVYRSDDAGENWRLPNPNGPGKGQGYNKTTNWNLALNPDLRIEDSYQQGFYNCAIGVSPTNPDHLIVGGIYAFKSTDGGVSFKSLPGYGFPARHPDIQVFAQQKNADGSVDTFLATDGGVNYSSDFFENESIVRTGGLGGDYWGFDVGEYNTTMGGGMYHNGDSYHVLSYGEGIFKYLGAAEASTGYIFPRENERQMYFSDFGGVIVSPNLNESFQRTEGLSPVPPEPRGGRDNQYYTQRDRFGNTYYHTQSDEDKAQGKVNLYYFSYKDNKTTLLKQIDIPKDWNVWQYMVSYSNPLYQYLFAGTKIFASTDGGHTWEAKGLPFPGNVILAMSDKDPKTVYALQRYSDKDNIVKISRDGGLLLRLLIIQK